MPQTCRNDQPPLLPAAGSLIHWFELLSKIKILSKYRNINDALIANQKRTATAVKWRVLTENPRWQRVRERKQKGGRDKWPPATSGQRAFCSGRQKASPSLLFPRSLEGGMGLNSTWFHSWYFIPWSHYGNVGRCRDGRCSRLGESLTVRNEVHRGIQWGHADICKYTGL